MAKKKQNEWEQVTSNNLDDFLLGGRVGNREGYDTIGNINARANRVIPTNTVQEEPKSSFDLKEIGKQVLLRTNPIYATIDYGKKAYDYIQNTKLVKNPGGNVLENIGATTADIGLDVTKGFLDYAEGIADFLQYRTADFSEAFGAENAANDLRRKGDIRSVNALFGENFTNDENIFERNINEEGEMAPSFREKISEKSYIDRGLDDVAEGVGQLLATMGTTELLNMAKITPTIKSTLIKNGVEAKKAADISKSIATSLTSYSSAYGSTYESVHRAGYGEKEAKTQARIAGFVEAISEQLHDGIPGTKTAGWADKINDKIATNRWLKSVMNSLGEVDEEVFGEILTTAINDARLQLNPDNEYLRDINLYTGDLRGDLKANLLGDDAKSEYLTVFLSSLITNAGSNIGQSMNKNQMIKDYAKENNIKYETAAKRLGLEINADNEITSNKSRLYNDTVDLIEKTDGEKLSDYSKKQIEVFIDNIKDSKVSKITSEDIADLYDDYKTAQGDNFLDNSLELFPTLQGEDQKRYYDLLNDVSKVIKNTGVNIQFNPELDKLSQWDGGTLVINPTMTDMPIKTILLKELSGVLLDNSSKQYILSYTKKNGLYDTLKRDLINSGEYDSKNVDTEIISRALNDILSDGTKLQEFAKSSPDTYNSIRDLVDNLSSNISLNRTTKDAEFLSNLSTMMSNVAPKKLINLAPKKVQTNKKAGERTQENIKKSGVVRNTAAGRTLTDLLTKISNEKGIEFDVTNNENIKKNKNIKGNINGYVEDNKIVINVDSKKRLNKVFGHEITHLLEGSKDYDTLKKMLIDYAKSQKDYDNRVKQLNELYKNVKNAEIENELVADLAGDYLFTDRSFVDSIARKDKNLFEKIFDSIKRFVKRLTGTDAEKQLLHIEDMYQEIYDNAKLSNKGVKYSLSLEGSNENTDNLGRSLTKAQQRYFRRSKVVNDKGELITVYHTTTRPVFQFDEFDPRRSAGDYQFGEYIVNYFTDDKTMSGSYAHNGYDMADTKKLKNIKEANEWAEEFMASINSTRVDGEQHKYTIEKIPKNGLIDEHYAMIEYERNPYHKEWSKIGTYRASNNLNDILKDFKAVVRQLEVNYKPTKNLQYEGYVNITNPYVVDLKGKYWANNFTKEMVEENINKDWFKKNVIQEYKYRNLKKLTSDDADMVRLRYEIQKLANQSFNKWSENADRLYNERNLYDLLKKKVLTFDQLYEGLSYLDFFPNYEEFYNSSLAKGLNLPEPSKKIDTGDTDIFPGVETTVAEIMDEYKKYKDAYDKYREKYTYFSRNIGFVIEDLGLDEEKYEELENYISEQTKDIFDFAMSDFDLYGSPKLWTQRKWYGDRMMETNDYVRDALEANEKGANYDGVIIRNVIDYGGGHVESETPHDLFITFESNQFKGVENKNPTKSSDIRYSLGEDNNVGGDFELRSEDISSSYIKKVLNPSQIAQLKPEDASTTPELPTRKYNKKGNGKSKQVETLQKSQLFTDEQKEQIINDEEFARYDKITNKESLEKAFDRLESGGLNETLRWMNKKSDVADATDIAEGIILLKHYGDIGNNAGMIEVAKKFREMKTITAQALQASSIMSRMTPEGMVAYAQSELMEAYDKLVKNKTKEWINQNRDKFSLTPDDVDFIMKTMEKVSQMEDGYEKKVELAKIQKLMTDKIPPDLSKSIKGWMRLSMLFNTKTQVRNIMGNTLITPMNAVGDMVASWADAAIARQTGVRTTGNANVRAYIEGAKRGAYEATNDYKLGINTRDVNGNRFEIGEGKSFTEKTIIGKGLNRAENLLNYVMDIGDRVFSEGAFENSLANQMRLNNVTEPTQEMIDIATTEALQRTWNDNNNYTKFVLDVRRMLNTIGGENYGLGDVLIPFAKTPANLTKAIVDYSPVGLVNSLLEYRNMKNAIGRGDFTPQQQHKFVQTLGKATAGTMLYIIGAALAKAGVISGKDDEDKDTKNFIKNVLGRNQYSIKIGDKSFTYDWAQPLAAPLSITANIVNSKNKENALLESVVASLDTAGSILLEQSFLQSINDVLTDNDGIVSGLINSILDLPARAIPTLSKQIADLADPVQRQTFEYNEPVKTAVNKVLVKIPGASKTLAPKVDTMGADVLKYGGNNNVFNVMFNPANMNKENVSQAGQEIYDVYKETGNNNIMPRVAPYYINQKGNKVMLDTNQIAEYQRISGATIETAMDEIMDDSKYQNASADEKASIIKNIVDYSYNYARDKVLGIDMPSTYDNANKYVNAGGNLGDYYLNQKEANYSMQNPEKYKVNSQIGNYEDYSKWSNDIKNIKANTTNDKVETINYIDSLPLSLPQKAMFIKQYYPKFNTYNNEIINYVDENVPDYNDKVEILTKLGFKVDNNGNVRW